MKYLFSLLLLIGCSTASQLSCPPPSVVTQIVNHYDTVSVIVKIPIQDTVLKIDTLWQIHGVVITDSFAVALNVDTTHYVIRLKPSGADDYPQLQAAINFEQNNGGYEIRLSPGNFPISHRLLAAVIGGQSYLRIRGASNAKNPIQGQISVIIPTFDNGFAFGLQMCKGCSIEDLEILGRYTFPNNLTPTQVDTLSAAQWQDGIHSFGRYSVYSGIAIDPFSPPGMYADTTQMYPGFAQYYAATISRWGSTSINMSGLLIQDFVSGVTIDPSFQQNGEMINLSESQISNCFADYSFTQAQSKANTYTNIENWGNNYVTLEGNRFGTGGGGAPWVSGVNIAQATHELVDYYGPVFNLTFDKIYAEGLYRIGELFCGVGGQISNSQFDFQQDAFPGIPLVSNPGTMMVGDNILFTNCVFRLYDNQSTYQRMAFFGFGYTFIGGEFGCPPLGGHTGSFSSLAPHFFQASCQYGPKLNDTTDSWNVWSGIGSHLLRVNKADNTGYVTGIAAYGLSVGDPLVSSITTDDYNPQVVDNGVIGYVTSVVADTARLGHVYFKAEDSTTWNLWDVKLKNQ